MAPIIALILQETAAAPAAAPAGAQPGFLESLFSGMFVPLALCFGVFYFLVIRPEGKQRKKRQAMLDAMKKGDDVVLSSGIHGSIAAIHEDIVTVQVDEGVRLKVSRAAVAEVKPAS